MIRPRLLLAASLLSLKGQQSPPPSAALLDVEKLSDNLFLLKPGGGVNSGGNTAVFVTSSGVTVIDTKIPGWGKPILDRVKELTDNALDACDAAGRPGAVEIGIDDNHLTIADQGTGTVRSLRWRRR